VPLEMLDDLGHAGVGPARIKLAGNQFARLLGDARQ
jgi:hypothetical protein